MIYAALGFLSLGSVALALWFRHKAQDAAAAEKRTRERIERLAADLAVCVKTHTENAKRYEAIVRGLKLDAARSEKHLHDHLERCPDPDAAREYIASQLSNAETTGPAVEYLPDPNAPKGRNGKGGS